MTEQEQADRPRTDNAAAVARVQEVLGCERVRDIHPNGDSTYYCSEHLFGWLHGVNACPRAVRAADAALVEAETELVELREANAKADRIAKQHALTSRALGREEHERNYLDICAVLAPRSVRRS